ncbi:hypothetical protein NDU88_004548 [Pleurodeles waltl]|uniref:Uncharacterized protein n=1 Tax=Pleurodeles waltl TaxID=8319 RepID=A0AAV7L1S0_PLEWA|nr:hypothetical protein NDU88_004548 [Pleurodeles waltl]
MTSGADGISFGTEIDNGHKYRRSRKQEGTLPRRTERKDTPLQEEPLKDREVSGKEPERRKSLGASPEEETTALLRFTMKVFYSLVLYQGSKCPDPIEYIRQLNWKPIEISIGALRRVSHQEEGCKPAAARRLYSNIAATLGSFVLAFTCTVHVGSGHENVCVMTAKSQNP